MSVVQPTLTRDSDSSLGTSAAGMLNRQYVAPYRRDPIGRRQNSESIRPELRAQADLRELSHAWEAPQSLSARRTTATGKRNGFGKQLIIFRRQDQICDIRHNWAVDYSGRRAPNSRKRKNEPKDASSAAAESGLYTWARRPTSSGMILSCERGMGWCREFGKPICIAYLHFRTIIMGRFCSEFLCGFHSSSEMGSSTPKTRRWPAQVRSLRESVFSTSQTSSRAARPA
jgi:hypothetical protein